MIVIRLTPAEEFALRLHRSGVTGPVYGRQVMEIQGACTSCYGFPNHGGAHAEFCPKRPRQ